MATKLPYRPEPDEFRDDRQMDRGLARVRFLLASSGLDPDHLPWRWIDAARPAPHPDQGLLYIGTRLRATAPKPEPRYFDRWRHRAIDTSHRHRDRDYD